MNTADIALVVFGTVDLAAIGAGLMLTLRVIDRAQMVTLKVIDRVQVVKAPATPTVPPTPQQPESMT